MRLHAIAFLAWKASKARLAAQEGATSLVAILALLKACQFMLFIGPEIL
jgi:hypothetical protein